MVASFALGAETTQREGTIMARLFNVEVFNKVINKSTTYYSDPQYNDLLGRADSVTLQVVVDSVSASDTVTGLLQVSNDGAPIDAVWTSTSVSVGVTPGSASDVPKSNIGRTSSTDPLGAFGRVKVTTSSTNGVAVRIIACGRSDV